MDCGAVLRTQVHPPRDPNIKSRKIGSECDFVYNKLNPLRSNFTICAFSISDVVLLVYVLYASSRTHCIAWASVCARSAISL